MKANTIDDISGYELAEIFPKPKTAKKAKKPSNSPKMAQKGNESTLDLTWLVVVTLFKLLGRGLKFVWRNKQTLSAMAFWVGAVFYLAVHFHVHFR